MNKRWLLNLALALFVIALALIVKFQPGRTPEAREQMLTDISSEAVQTIKLERPDQPPINFERDGQEWRITAPVRARADRFRLDGLLQLVSAKIRDRFAASGDLTEYGLDKPAAHVELGSVSVDIGGMHPLNDLRYVRYQNNIYLVPNANVRAALSPLSDYFSARLIEENRKPIAFDFPQFHLRLVNGSWIGPDNKNIASDVLNGFVDEWRYARALSVERYSNKPVSGHLRITYISEEHGKAAAPQPRTLDLGILARKPEFVLYRADEGLEYHFPQETGERLLTLAPRS